MLIISAPISSPRARKCTCSPKSVGSAPICGLASLDLDFLLCRKPIFPPPLLLDKDLTYRSTPFNALIDETSRVVIYRKSVSFFVSTLNKVELVNDGFLRPAEREARDFRRPWSSLCNRWSVWVASLAVLRSAAILASTVLT